LGRGAWAGAFTVLLTLSGPALADARSEPAAVAWSRVQLAAAIDGENFNDPIEPINRAIFQFNEVIQDVLLRPVGKAYKSAVPDPVRASVGNFLDNVSAPVVLVNDLLQGESDRAMLTMGRFVVNTVIGVGGMFDVAAQIGMEEHREDFGQTMGAWGVGEGFYLVLPIFGPSNPRDAIGKFLIDGYFDPAGHWISNTDNTSLDYARTGMEGVDTYAGVMDELEKIKKTSLDYYAAIRSMYRQKRRAEIGNGSEIDLPPIPDLSYSFDENSFGSSGGSLR